MNETLKTIHSLRSVHGGFSTTEVSSEDLQTVLGASVRAASASLRQSYSIVVVEDRGLMKEVAQYEASKCLVYCVDFTRISDAFARLGYEATPQTILSFMAAAVDTTLAAQNAALAAASLGIDSLFTNGIHRAPLDLVYEKLMLPRESCFPLIALFLGYAVAREGKPKGRYIGPGLVHFGYYRRLSEDQVHEMIGAYDSPANDLGLTQEWASAGMDHYLDWLHKRDATRVPGSAKIQTVQDALVRASFWAG